MLQIFVRLHSLNLVPDIQHQPIPELVAGEWRHLFDPEGTDALLYVRNDVEFYDCQLEAGTTSKLPLRPGWHTYLYVFDGVVEIRGESVGYTESALVSNGRAVDVLATEDSTIVAFLINPDAPVTRQGTIGR